MKRYAPLTVPRLVFALLPLLALFNGGFADGNGFLFF